MRTFVRVAARYSSFSACQPLPPVRAHPSFSVTVTGRGPAIVLIPGLLSTGEVWSSTVERYQKQYSLHTVTLAGFGGPPPIGSPFLSRVRDELIAYMRDQKMQKPIVIGHSLGGFLAFWIAATAPDLVGGVIAVDGVPYLPALGNPAATPETTAARPKQMQTIYASLSQEQLIAQSRMAMTTMMTAPADVDRAMAWVAQVRRRHGRRAIAEMMTHRRAARGREDYGAGTADWRARERAGADASDARKGLSRRRWRSCGRVPVKMAATRHFIMLDDPSFLFAAIDEFVASLPKR